MFGKIRSLFGRPRRVLIFVHIPKTAGVSFSPIIDRWFPASAVLAFEYDDDASGRLMRLRAMRHHRRARLALVRGHVTWGLHTAFSEKRESTYFTFVRDPVERLVSEYHHILRTPAHGHHVRLTRSGMNLEEYATSDLLWTCDNAQVRCLTGAYDVGVPCTEQSLRQALDNLDHHFVFSGLTERFDESVLLLRKLMGFKEWPVYARQNVGGKDRPATADLDASVVRTIRTRNRFDIQLYEHCKSRLDRLLLEHDILSELPEFRERQALQRGPAAVDHQVRAGHVG